MSVSPVEFAKEMVRQSVNQDESFYKKFVYYFELQLPTLTTSGISAGTSSRFVFPLILPPESYSIDDQFTVSFTPTQRGGLYTEENGIIKRPIKIQGTTGFKPRPLKTYNWGSHFVGALPYLDGPQTTSYSRKLPPTVTGNISGHRHFQYLQDSVFRTYADLKRDPATSKDTKMFFHNPKDDEHFRVVPQRFTLIRDKERPTLYNYSIEMTAIAPADDSFDVDFDDKNILDTLNNVLYAASLGLNLCAGAINDLTAIADDIHTQLSNITVLIDNVTTIITATEDFVNGVEDLINLPYTYVQSAIELADAVAQTAESSESVTQSQSMLVVAQNIRKVSDGLEMIGVNPSAFETSNSATMKTVRGRQELRRTVSKERETEISNTAPPSTLGELEALGTALTAGEVESAKGTVLAGGEIRKYRSLRKVAINQGDSLASLAAQYMGDARLWQYIAIANGLQPPYVDDQASTPLNAAGADETPFGHSLGKGGEIVIPSNTAAPKDYPLAPVGGTRIEEPVDNQLFGIDAKLVTVNNVILGDARSRFDIDVDVEHGSKDVKLVEGMDNLQQAITMRLVTENGTDPMYRHVGIKRIVGQNFNFADLANARFRIRETVLADPRISTVRDLQFTQQVDGLKTEMDAIPRGFSESRAITTIL